MQKTTREPPILRGRKGKGDIMSKITGKADSKRKGKAEATTEAKASQQATASKPTADSKASKADKPAGRAEAEAKALTLVGDVKSHTGGRINLDSVRICPRKGGKVKAFLRPTYIVPDGVTLTPYEAGGFTGFTICDLTTETGRQTLAALIAAKRKPTAAETKKAQAADKATGKGKADSKPQAADKPQSKAQGKAQADKPQTTAGKATGQAGKGKAAGKPQADKATQGKSKSKAGKATA